MKTFEYMQPENIESASKFLTKNKDSIAFAGGTDLLGLMKDDIFSPKQLVNLKKIGDLNFIKYNENEGLRIGALTKLSEIENHNIVKEKYNVLYQSIYELATPQLKNIGTLGGNICQRPRCFYFRGDYDCIRKGGDTCFAITGHNKYHCIVGGDPCYIVHPSDTAVALVALNAKFKIFDGKNEKTIPAEEFFILPNVDETKENILNSGELLTEIIIPPINNNTVSSYIKVKERGAWDFALVSIAGVFNKNDNKITDGKIVFGGVAPSPWQDKKINDNLVSFNLTQENIKKLSSLAFEKTDVLEMNEYKVTLAKNLIIKLLLETFNI
ncbi:MAG: xanthine dehydrogenase family protein subunit M [Ignavibacteriae bacterium]|nr:xanthine dehydrogenase family protein subunit M [Ignavibacteriota bacterium]MCB9206797.1 xanthine dehydrogenase family protein subunit M [Ignavibacteriales bacterium]MCB9210195.1 xanthine dehydrogenase family protein subunit M [Ignavibacteriales bacterium]MCB9218420.1 xanthine dehydrogenase family protein subunit M [Ignavibacteriales bacterium]MCB9259574.1 xanthine dehydrogenase family protein subunit M [Ignavibacteriales bacterium]